MPILPLPVFTEEQERKAIEALQPPKTIVVRYGYMAQIGEFPYDGGQVVGCGSKLVVRTPRGVELGTMLTTTCSNSGCGKSISRAQMLAYIEASGGKQYPFTKNGRVMRVATGDDLAEQARIDAYRPQYTRAAKDAIRELDLPMKLVEVEPLLSADCIVFYFTSEHRVDFRELVKRLAGELHVRVEMRQVGARDEARLVADYEKCGQHCCCKQFLKVLKPVSMRSAKVQKGTLDPTKISGRCGRLMCCLRYEDKTYEQLRKNLPNRKALVMTEDGPGIVVNTQILTQLVLVELDGSGERQAYPVENVERITKQQAEEYHTKKAEEVGRAAAERREGRRVERRESDLRGGADGSRNRGMRDEGPRGGEGRTGGESRGSGRPEGQIRGGERRGGEPRSGERRGGDAESPPEPGAMDDRVEPAGFDGADGDRGDRPFVDDDAAAGTAGPGDVQFTTGDDRAEGPGADAGSPAERDSGSQPPAPGESGSGGREGGRRKRRRRRGRGGDRGPGQGGGPGGHGSTAGGHEGHRSAPGEPRRPRPGDPLRDDEVRSKEGGRSSDVAPSFDPNDGPDRPDAPSDPSSHGGGPDGGPPADGARRRKRRRRRRRRPGDGGPHGESGGGGGGGGGPGGPGDSGPPTP